MRNVIDSSFKYLFSRNFSADGYEKYNFEWYLSPQGDMMNTRSGYTIEHDILKKDDWVLHLSEKRWFDANTFIPAYFEACRRAGLREVVMRVIY